MAKRQDLHELLDLSLDKLDFDNEPCPSVAILAFLATFISGCLACDLTREQIAEIAKRHIEKCQT